MNTEERANLLTALHKSTEGVLTAVASVNDNTFLQQPNQDSWSLAHVVEHLVLTDASILWAIHKKSTRLQEDFSSKWENTALAKIISQRDRKVIAPKNITPTGKYPNKEEAIQAFKKNREKVVQFVETTTLPLEKITFKHPFLGRLDGKNWIAFLAAHCERHTKQMNEIKTKLLASL